MSSNDEYQHKNYLQEYPLSTKDVFKPKVLGFSAVFYGKEYMQESLLSIKDHVDLMYIAYTQTPSHGVKTGLACPDTEEELRSIAQEVMGPKLIWESFSGFENEALHRNLRYKHSQGMDAIVSIDMDEVFVNVQEALAFLMSHPERYNGTRNYFNFWKSFNHVCTDTFAPIRLERLDVTNQLQNHENQLQVFHFSTAQSSKMIAFKNKIFGHASEIRPDWFEEIYLKWTPESKIRWLHCVSLQIWENAVPYDKTQMPEYLKQHPNYNLDLIP